jgi:hypothetical protein
MLVQNLHVEADGFFAGEGVEIAADGIHFAGDKLGRARFGALEDHVLDEMGDSVYFRQLVPRTGAHPHSHGYGADVVHLFGQNSEPVGQHGAANISFVIHNVLRFLKTLRDVVQGQARVQQSCRCVMLTINGMRWS